jgi:hypothetical protein
MNNFSPLGKLLIAAGLLLVLAGLIVTFAGRIPWLGRLPGDIHLRGKNWDVYVPLGTSILVSVVLTLILWLLNRR